SVVVPKNFGTLTWTLTAHGETATAIANDNPHNTIDRKHSTLRGPGDGADVPDNTPPVVTVEPQALTLQKGAHGKVAIAATDDGLPRLRGKSAELSYQASVFRGTGPATFAAPAGKLDTNGKGT